MHSTVVRDGTTEARPSVHQKEHVMGFIWMLIVGLVAGALAKLVMPGKQGGGIIMTMLLGIVGSFVAGAFGRAVGWYHSPEHGPGIIASAIGAFVVLAIYGVVTRRGSMLHHH
jgi:uncharacterized membrane protein YeaQ/YmgE (transglycosylase-associated protein family)